MSLHLSKVANVSIRNVASWAGNLIMKYNHQASGSDLFVMFETIKASIRLVGPSKSSASIDVSPLGLLTTSMKGRLVYSMSLKPFDSQTNIIKTYKVMPRSQNSRAYVNAGFNFQMNATNKFAVESCSIVFGGLSAKFVHATQTEKFLVKMQLNDEATILQAFKTLQAELIVDEDPVIINYFHQ